MRCQTEFERNEERWTHEDIKRDTEMESDKEKERERERYTDGAIERDVERDPRGRKSRFQMGCHDSRQHPIS